MNSCLIDKIIGTHIIDCTDSSGYKLRLDQVYFEDSSSIQAFGLLNEYTNKDIISFGNKVCFYITHNICSKKDDMLGHMYAKQTCKKYGFQYFEPCEGISHQVHVEKFAFPGCFILGANSHTAYCGGVGCLALGVGATEIIKSFISGGYYFRFAKIININLEGFLCDGVSEIDLCLYMFSVLREHKLSEYIIEFSGIGVKALNCEQRMVITHFCVEYGAITALFPSDEITYDYLKSMGRESSWVSLKADVNAKYDIVIDIDLKQIIPYISFPSDPANVRAVADCCALKIEQIVVGGCAGGTYTNIKKVYNILKGRSVSKDTRLIIFPNSKLTLEKMISNGIYLELIRAGAEISMSSCDMCVGIIYVPSEGINSMRTISRNYRGRSGCSNDSVYLASPETAAITSLSGYVSRHHSDVITALEYDRSSCSRLLEDFEKRFSFPSLEIQTHQKDSMDYLDVLHVFFDDISTDEIIPNGSDVFAHRSNIEELSEYLFYRIAPDIINKINNHKKSKWVIIGGNNFGRGSARENAAAILKFLNIKAIIAKSFSNTFKNNLLNFGVVPLVFVNKEDFKKVKENDVLSIFFDENTDKIFAYNRTNGEKIRLSIP